MFKVLWRALLLTTVLLPLLAFGRCEIPREKNVRAVPAPLPGEWHVASQNMQRLFDDAANGPGPQLDSQEYARRQENWARYMITVLQAPAVLAVQEVENIGVLEDLARAIRREQPGLAYQAVLREGNDGGGIDVGFLVRADFSVTAVEPLMAKTRLGLDGSLLYDRPPLRLRLQGPRGPVELVGVHLRSLRDSDSEAKSLRIAVKRARQAELLAQWLRLRQQQEPGLPILVLGDFNATEDSAGGVDVLAQFTGHGFLHLNQRLPSAERYTYVYRCRRQSLDHALASPAWAQQVSQVAVSRGNAWADGRRRKQAGSLLGLSDHDGLVVYMRGL